MGIIYSKYKMFHYPEKLNSLDDKKLILPPLQVRIKPTNMCNHNCWYCAYKAENLQLGKDMVERDYIPLNKMLEIIKDLDEMGVKSLTFSGGGEPLTYKYMRESLEALSQTKVKFASLTNGSKLNGDVSQLFKQYGSWIRVSIDGWDDNSYAKYRNVKSGEFSKVIKNMYEFSKLNGECLLGVSIIIDKDNAPHLENLVKLLKDTGVKSIKLSPCITHNESELTNSYHSDFFEITKEKCKIPEATQTGTKFAIRNKGFKTLNGNTYGDFIYNLIVQTPKKLTKEQRDLLVELAKTMNEQPPIKKKGIFG